VAKSIRVGKFTVEDVQCTVMPPGLSGPPLLGMSFFKSFNFKIDQGKGQLIMTRVDTSDSQ
jgi:predicted aspartyl protease